MVTEEILVKHQDKRYWPTDWNNVLKEIWVSDKQPPSIYGTEWVGHYWDDRNIVDRSA